MAETNDLRSNGGAKLGLGGETPGPGPGGKSGTPEQIGVSRMTMASTASDSATASCVAGREADATPASISATSAIIAELLIKGKHRLAAVPFGFVKPSYEPPSVSGQARRSDSATA
jgi:hypothetical protein